MGERTPACLMGPFSIEGASVPEITLGQKQAIEKIT